MLWKIVSRLSLLAAVAFFANGEAGAMERLKEAAETGDVDATFELGRIYELGQDVPKDLDMAIYWYKKVIELNQDYMIALERLGELHAKRRGSSDLAEAVSWFQKAAEAGSVFGICGLKIMYERGYYARQDLNTALSCFQFAAANESIALGYNQEGGVQQNLNANKDLYEIAADVGDLRVISCVEHMYKEGYGVRQDLDTALSWFQKAAEAGNLRTMICWGDMHAEGLGIPKDLDTALSWLQKAADLGDAQAMCRFGGIYGECKFQTTIYDPEGVRQDPAKAVFWYRKAVDTKDTEFGFNFLRYMYEHGEGVLIDQREAAYWSLQLKIYGLLPIGLY